MSDFQEKLEEMLKNTWKYGKLISPINRKCEVDSEIKVEHPPLTIYKTEEENCVSFSVSQDWLFAESVVFDNFRYLLKSFPDVKEFGVFKIKEDGINYQVTLIIR